ncbi:MAG: tetratricopeptide repeat protein [Ignavibacteria bacterium]
MPLFFNMLQRAKQIFVALIWTSQENPGTYLSYVATTLNNLAILQKAKNEYAQALENYEEALKIYRDLAKENHEAYEIDYARMLIMGAYLFEKDKEELKRAKKILEKYPNVYTAQRLLELIKTFE